MPRFGPLSEETKKKISIANSKPRVPIVCATCEKVFTVWPSKATRSKTCSKPCQFSFQTTKHSWNFGLKGYLAGTNHYNWKGGITPLNHAIRNSAEYSKWRKAVFTRDSYTCVIGGRAHGSKLNADHIKRFAEYPELRLDISNGRTLCTSCHKQTETWGRKHYTTNLQKC